MPRRPRRGRASAGASRLPASLPRVTLAFSCPLLPCCGRFPETHAVVGPHCRRSLVHIGRCARSAQQENAEGHTRRRGSHRTRLRQAAVRQEAVSCQKVLRESLRRAWRACECEARTRRANGEQEQACYPGWSFLG